METLRIQARTHGHVLVRRPTYPVGVLVGYHGYAESAETQMERLAAIRGAEAWTLVSVQALNRFYLGKTEDVVACWMTWQDRELAIVDNVWYVDAALDNVHNDPALPLVHVGYSQGAAMAFRAGVRGRRRAAAVVSVGGDVPPELLHDDAATFPAVLLLRGGGDDWYTQSKFDRDVEALRQRGVALDARVYDGRHEWNAAVSEATAALLSGVAIHLPLRA